MDNHHDDPHYELAAMLMGAYVLIDKILGWLPIPISLPPIDDEDWDGIVAVRAIDNARTAMRDLPMEPLTASVLDKLLLEWLTAHALGAINEMVGPEPWRLEAMAYTLTRIKSLAELVETRLKPDRD